MGPSRCIAGCVFAWASVQYLFWDNERLAAADQEIYYSRYSAGAWSAPATLPSPPFHQSGVSETQPFFDGSRMIVRRGDSLESYRYLGGAIGDAAAWSGPEVLLAPQSGGFQSGSVAAVGEPNIAVVDGRRVLYFVYALVEPGDSNRVNVQVGYVEQR